jgi:hypothetical protein
LINSITILEDIPVKALVISMSILLVVVFSFSPALGQSPDVNKVQPVKQKEEPAAKPEPQKNTEANTLPDISTIADINAIADPNAVTAEIKKFKGLSEDLKKVDTESKDEISKWTSSREEKLDLALAVQKQITEELKLLRELAVKEGAVKTTLAIDGILIDRQERFKDVIDKLEKEADRARREKEEKRNKEREQREHGTMRRPSTDRNK